MGDLKEPDDTALEAAGAEPSEEPVAPAPVVAAAEPEDETEREPGAPAGAPATRPASPVAVLSQKWRRALWGAGTLAALGLLVWLAVLAPTVSAPLLVAFIIAYLLDPLVDRFEARGVKRTAAIALILGVFVLFVVGLALIVVPQVTRELAQIPEALRQGLSRLGPWVQATFGVEVPDSLEAVLAMAQQELAGLDLTKLVAPTGKVVQGIYGGTMGALAAIAGAVMVPVFAFYLLRDFDDLVARVRELIPARFRPAIGARFREIDAAMSSFIRGQITVALILSVLYSAGLWIAGLPLAFVVGVIAGVGNMVPYVGTVVGIALAVALSLLSGDVGLTLLKVGAVFALVQGLEGWVITPKVVGESIGLSSFAVIVAVLFFGEVFGFVGVLIAVPLAAILKILLRVGLEAYRQSAFYGDRER